MNHGTRRLAAIVGAFALFIVGLAGLAPSVASASPPSHWANIRNGGSSSDPGFLVCENWGASGCRSDSARGMIYPGENARSKFGWDDTDGIVNPTGRQIFMWGNAGGRPGWVYVGRQKELKVGGCGGCTMKYYVH